MAAWNKAWCNKHPDYHLGRYANLTGLEKQGVKALVRRWASENPEAVVAHNKLKLLRRNGEWENAAECSECGVKTQTHAHHEDYSKPLEVVYLCRSCHKAIHTAVAV